MREINYSLDSIVTNIGEKKVIACCSM